MFQKIIEIKLEIAINQKLYQKSYIDEEMFMKTNDILLKKLDSLEVENELQ